MKTIKLTITADDVFQNLKNKDKEGYTCFYFKDVCFDEGEIEITAVVEDDDF